MSDRSESRSSFDFSFKPTDPTPTLRPTAVDPNKITPYSLFKHVLLEKSGTSMMSLASPADDSLTELSKPLSPLDDDGGDTRWWPVPVLSYTVVTELSCCMSPPLVVDMSARCPSSLRFRPRMAQLPCHTHAHLQSAKRVP